MTTDHKFYNELLNACRFHFGECLTNLDGTPTVEYLDGIPNTMPAHNQATIAIKSNFLLDSLIGEQKKYPLRFDIVIVTNSGRRFRTRPLNLCEVKKTIPPSKEYISANKH